MNSIQFGFFLVLGVQCWSNEQLMIAVTKACPADYYYCPKREYGIFSGTRWEWDVDAIIKSEMGEIFRRSRFLNKDTLKGLQDSFCCSEGPCLTRCGIYPKTEIDLIQKFPSNAMDILNLNLPQIEVHRPAVMEWMNTIKQKSAQKNSYPAEIEDFFDTVHANQDIIRERLDQDN
ncbi:uncharacterized protein CELE_F38B2.2 [Caenorhabditis elegans]|uniref:Uncharacterized protein n=1 Tax=Caenorhabditis elegans TaxID=6239 RepID=Q20138_CAEEL|nr:Uncharacterized protein CELE_F38B2.2 [Caenorhabditis elegans]CAA90362.1 Uncharacterized protein CELE_F38B2.2 [Caenorhabditis elegans]|eukprot:NP_509882.1 Uncharacterized protein CELE_F38B2.2 [Caenorhabditis elegans]